MTTHWTNAVDVNMNDVMGQPMIFSCLRELTPENLRVLIAGGLDINAMAVGSPLVLESAMGDRWDLVSVLIEHGVDVLKRDRDGRTVIDDVHRRCAEAERDGRLPDPEIVQVQDQLAALLKPR
jgi:hypothetical protein